MDMDIAEYDRYSPFQAALAGRDDAAREDIFRRFAALPDDYRQFLVAPSTAQIVADWERAGVFPPNYRTAVAKTLMLTALGEVKPEALGALFRRIGLTDEQARTLSGDLNGLLDPFLNAPEPEPVPDIELDPGAGEPTEMLEVPPLTASAPEADAGTAQEAETMPNSVPNTPSRNIIDLRKQS